MRTACRAFGDIGLTGSGASMPDAAAMRVIADHGAITGCIILVMIMQLVETTIASVALRSFQGSISVKSDRTS